MLIAARAVWLAASVPVKPVVDAQPATAPIDAAKPQRRLSAADYAAIMGMCPSAARELPSEVLPESVARRMAQLRIASRNGQVPSASGSSAVDWLVPPDRWFVPEDQPPIETETVPETVMPPLTPPQSSAPSREEWNSAPPREPTALPAPTPQPEVLQEPDSGPSGWARPDQFRNDPPIPQPSVSPNVLPPKVRRPVAEPLPAPVPSPMAAPSMVAPVVPAPSMPAPSPVVQPQPVPPRQPTSVLQPLTPHSGVAAADQQAARDAAGGKSADESHADLFAKHNYPSALQCAECHKRIYDEWSVSSHAYSYMSPMFHKFEQKITELSNGTVGHFCTRCHSPVATAMYEPRSTPMAHMAETAREGVTCIVCHRVNQHWGKSNGERRIVPGDIYQPVYGGVGGDGVAQVVADPKKYKVKLSPGEKGPGMEMHNEGRFFSQLTKSEACMSCHQVAVHPGIKLEVVWEQYRASPACKKGITCQECHMGRVPGMAGGFNYGPVAEINGKVVNNHRKQHSHVFYGPGYSIAHPGVFPQNKDAKDWTMNEWLAFDWRAGWGTDEFEDRLEEFESQGADTSTWFPAVWAEADDRFDAREIIEDNLARLRKKRHYRELVMENGSKVDGPFFRSPPVAGKALKFDYIVTNVNEGHNLPTASLGAQPQLWANVVLIGPNGRRLWESGYTDSNGDLCDIHSLDVREGRLPFDKQLFNLQTMFLITGASSTDREFPLPVNIDFDQVAHLRPGNVPYTVLNHPPFIRMESRSLAALGRKRVKYTVPKKLMCQPGRYRLSFRMRSRTEPMYFMRLCEATPEMLRSMVEGTLDIHPQSVEFEVR